MSRMLSTAIAMYLSPASFIPLLPAGDFTRLPKHGYGRYVGAEKELVPGQAEKVAGVSKGLAQVRRLRGALPSSISTRTIVHFLLIC